MAEKAGGGPQAEQGQHYVEGRLPSLRPERRS